MASLTPVFESVTNGTQLRILELAGRLEHAADGTITSTRKKLAEVLHVAQRTISSAVKHLEELGILERLNGLNYVFRWGKRRPTAPPPAKPAAPKDASTSRQTAAGFADGRVRAGAAPREPDPSFEPWLWPRAFELAKAEGAEVVQVARILAEKYVDPVADPYAAENLFPMHPKFVEVAWARMVEGLRDGLELEHKRARSLMAPPAPRPDAPTLPDMRKGFGMLKSWLELPGFGP